MKRFFALFLVLMVLASCSEYQKALKNEDVAQKYKIGEKMYEAKKYQKALRLFEQIAPTYRGKPQAEKLFYMYGKSFYAEKEFYSAGYQFDNFVSSYPRSEKIEEAAYLGAISYSKLSPRYSLDQVDTYKAIDKLQSFIDNYPDSKYLAEANDVVKQLREKIEKKNFEIAKQYNTISDHKSALVALDIFLGEFPGTPFKEEALYYRFDSAYQLAINSIESKKEERLLAAKQAHATLIKFAPESIFRKKADEMLEQLNNDLKSFSK